MVTCVRLADWPDAGLEMEEKLSFFRETRHAFGRTALLLSGGGGLGSFHLVSGGGLQTAQTGVRAICTHLLSLRSSNNRDDMQGPGAFGSFHLVSGSSGGGLEPVRQGVNTARLCQNGRCTILQPLDTSKSRVLDARVDEAAARTPCCVFMG